MLKKYSLFILFLIFIFISCTERKDNKSIEVNYQSVKVKIITFVSHEVLDAVVNSTRNSLITDYNIPQNNIEVFNPNGNLDEIRAYVRTLNSRNTDVIISVSTPASQAVLSTRHPSIPLVFSFVSDTSSLSLSHYPNVTGISNVLNYEKGFELLKKLLPNLSRICVVYNPTEPNSNYSYNQIVENAKKQTPPVNVVTRQFSNDNEISITASTITNVDAFYVGGDNKLVKNIKLLLNVANNKNIPVFASDEGSVLAGAIAAYSIDYSKFGNETAKLTINVLSNRSAKNIDVIMYSDGKNIINKTALNIFKIDYSKLTPYEEIK